MTGRSQSTSCELAIWHFHKSWPINKVLSCLKLNTAAAEGEMIGYAQRWQDGDSDGNVVCRCPAHLCAPTRSELLSSPRTSPPQPGSRMSTTSPIHQPWLSNTERETSGPASLWVLSAEHSPSPPAHRQQNRAADPRASQESQPPEPPTGDDPESHCLIPNARLTPPAVPEQRQIELLM